MTDEEPSKLVRLTPATQVSMPVIKFIGFCVALVTVTLGGYKGYVELQQSLSRLDVRISDVAARVSTVQDQVGAAARLEARVRALEEWREWATPRLPRKRDAQR